MKRFILAGLLSLATPFSFAQEAVPIAVPEIVTQNDVVYGTGGGQDLHLDLAMPKPEPGQLGGGAPCIVAIHGGAWRQGDKKQLRVLIAEMAKLGYVGATVQYRFCPEHKFPAQVEDVKCAVRFLRAHADQYGIDPERIGAIGFSAGAHLSMMLGTMDADDGMEGEGGWPDQSSKVQAVVSYFGPTQFGTPDTPSRSSPLVTDFLGGTMAEKPDAYKNASPLTYVTSGDAPMLLFQGTEDVLVPYSQAIAMVTAMTDADVPGRVEFLIDAGHGWGGAMLQRTNQQSIEFFDQILRK